jgi:hypothetical protein
VSIYEPPVSVILAGLLLLLAAVAAARGVGKLVHGLVEAVPLTLVRGLRGCVIALALAACALGIGCAQSGFVVLGLVFLGEELYERARPDPPLRTQERQE